MGKRGERGAVHVYLGKYTKKDPNDPTKRITVETGKYFWAFTFGGRPYNGGPGERTKEAARAHGERLRDQLRGGMEDDPRKVKYERLEALLLSETASKDITTVRSIKNALRHLREFFGGYHARHITRERGSAYLEFRRKQGAANASINLEVGYLTRMLNLGHQARLLMFVPKMPRLKTVPRRETLLPHEFALILDQIRKRTPWWTRFFLCLDEMGWRAKSELLTREWSHVHWDPGYVELDAASSKTDTRRIFPMTAFLRETLTAQRAHVSAIEQRTGKIIPWLWVLPDGSPLKNYKKAWQLALDGAGFKKLPGKKGPWSNSKVPHDIRRTAISRWNLEIGVARQMGPAVAGHSEEQHANYTVVDKRALEVFRRQLEEYRKVAQDTNVEPFRRAELSGP